MRLGELKPNENNLREQVTNIVGLADSIKGVGLLQPLLIKEDGTIIAGHRRYAAMMRLVEHNAEGWTLDTEVPVQVTDRNGTFDVEAMLVENLQREGITPVEEAQGYQRLIDLGKNQKEIASSVGVSQAHVSKRLSLLKLPASAHKALAKEQITVEQAYDLVKLVEAPPEMMKEALEYPNQINRLVSMFTRAQALEEVEAKAREVGATPVRDFSSVPKPSGMVAVVDWDTALTVDEVGDLAVAEGEDLYVMIRSTPQGEGQGAVVEFVPKEEIPAAPKDPHTEMRREISSHRKAQLHELLSQTPKRTEVQALLVQWFLDPATHSSSVVQAAAKALGLTPVRVQDPYDAEKTVPDWSLTLAEFGAESAVKQTQVLYSLFLQEMAGNDYGWLPETSRAILDTLGYEPHPKERRES